MKNLKNLDHYENIIIILVLNTLFLLFVQWRSLKSRGGKWLLKMEKVNKMCGLIFTNRNPEKAKA